MPKPSVDAVTQLSARIALLERRVRRSQRQLLLLVALAGGAVAVAVIGIPTRAAGGASWRRTLEATRFVLRDASGKMRGELRAGSEPGLTLFNDSGKATAGLALSKGASYLFLNDEGGTQRAVISYQPGMQAFGLNLNDESGVGRAALLATKKGSTLIMHDADSQKRVSLSASKESSLFTFQDSQGKTRLGLRHDDKAGPVIGLMNEKGRYLFRKP